MHRFTALPRTWVFLLGLAFLPMLASAGEAGKPLLFLGNQSIPPIISLQDGKPEGVVVDLAYAVAQKAGLSIEVRAMNWTEAQQRVASGQADALLQINPNPERLAVYDFSDVLLESRFHIFRSIHRSDIHDLASLDGMKVGVERGGFPVNYLKKIDGIQIEIIPSWKAGFEMLERGEIDAVFVDRWVGEYELQLHKFHGITVADPPVVTDQSRIAVKKGNTALLDKINAGLRGIEQDGTREALLNRWQAKEVVYLTRESLERWKLYGIAAAGVVLIGLALTSLDHARRVKKTNRELQESRDAVRHLMAEQTAILNSELIGICKLKDRHFTYVNDEFARLFGYDKGELTGQPTRLVYADDESYAQFAARAYPALQSGQTFRTQMQYRRKDGALGWYEVNGIRPRPDDDESIWAFLDVTAHVEASREIAFMLSERTALLENSLVGIVTVQDRRILWANTAFANMLGYAKEELTGMPTRQNYPSEEAYRAVGEAAYPVLAAGRVYRTSVEHVRKDGQHIWVDMAGALSSADKGISLWGFIDNTARITSENRLREAQAIAHVGSWDLDHATQSLTWSDEMFRIYGLDPASTPTVASCWSTVHPDDCLLAESVFRYALQSRSNIDIRQRVVVPGEDTRYVHVIGETTFDKDGKPLRSAGTAQDITLTVLQEQALQESEERFRTIADYTYDWEYWQGANGVIDYMSPACERVSGYSATDFQFDPALLQRIVHPDDAPLFADHLAHEIETPESSITFRIRHKNGTVRWIAHGCRAVTGKDGTPRGRRVNNRDITELKDAEERANRLAFYDVLTGLPNRRLLMSRLEQGLSQARRFGRALAVMFLDLDHFKEVNDTLGHPAGDQLLVDVANRLTTCVRAGDTVARSGGDEFIIVLQEIANATDAHLVAEKILDKLASPFDLMGSQLTASASIGMAVYPASGDDREDELLRKADSAMYAAKRAGRNNYKVFGDGH